MDELDDFLEFEAKVNELSNIFKDTASVSNNAATEINTETNTNEKEKPSLYDIDVEKIKLKVTNERSILNRKCDPPSAAMPGCAQMDAATFMKQTEEDANERSRQRQEREGLADNLKKRASEAFRRKDFEEAAIWYTKAIEQMKDSVTNHANRALCYYRLKNYSRSLRDCDFVLHKLHEYNLRVLIYRAACCKRLNDCQAFEDSIELAKQHHPNRLELIDRFVEKINKEEF